MTDHTGGNITIEVQVITGTAQDIAKAIAQALEAGRARRSRWQRFRSWLRRCLRG